MKQLFKLFLLVNILLNFSLSSNAQEKKFFSVGVSNDYGFGGNFNNHATTFKLNYYPVDNFRIAPSYSYYLDKNSMKMRAFSFNFNYLFPDFLSNIFPSLNNQSMVFYPLAGFYIVNASEKKAVCKECSSGGSPGSDYLYNFGFDFGVGVDYDLPTSLPVLKDVTVNFEMQYQAVERFSRPQILLGIIYNL
jgi:hypothetical protein